MASMGSAPETSHPQVGKSLPYEMTSFHEQLREMAAWKKLLQT